MKVETFLGWFYFDNIDGKQFLTSLEIQKGWVKTHLSNIVSKLSASKSVN